VLNKKSLNFQIILFKSIVTHFVSAALRVFKSSDEKVFEH